MPALRLIVIFLGCLSLISCGGSDSPPDADADSHPDSADCAPADPGAWDARAFRSRDADADGFLIDHSGSLCAGDGLPAGYFAGAAPPGNIDCDDADAARWVTLAYASRDRDGDQHFTAEAGSMCTAGALPSGYLADEVAGTGIDCDDADALNWLSVDYVGRDSDADSHYVPSPGQLCLAGTTLPAGYSMQVSASLVDCDDADTARWRLVSVYADQDGDGVGAGARLMQCMGSSPPAGMSLQGYDPNDDAADPAAVTISELELPSTLLVVAEEAEDF